MTDFDRVDLAEFWAFKIEFVPEKFIKNVVRWTPSNLRWAIAPIIEHFGKDSF